MLPSSSSAQSSIPPTSFAVKPELASTLPTQTPIPAPSTLPTASVQAPAPASQIAPAPGPRVDIPPISSSAPVTQPDVAPQRPPASKLLSASVSSFLSAFKSATAGIVRTASSSSLPTQESLAAGASASNSVPPPTQPSSSATLSTAVTQLDGFVAPPPSKPLKVAAPVSAAIPIPLEVPQATPPEPQYAISDYESTDEEDDEATDDENDQLSIGNPERKRSRKNNPSKPPGNKKIPKWANRQELLQQLLRQRHQDPDTIFPPLPDPRLDQMFSSTDTKKQAKYRNRNSIATWI